MAVRSNGVADGPLGALNEEYSKPVSMLDDLTDDSASDAESWSREQPPLAGAMHDDEYVPSFPHFLVVLDA